MTSRSTFQPARPRSSCSPGDGADPRIVELELAAQAEHGPDSVCRVVSVNGDLEAALAAVEELAPEHLVLLGDEAEAAADARPERRRRVRRPVVPGRRGRLRDRGNHVLPTGGWARAVGGIGLETFLKPITIQRLTPEGLAALRPVVEALAAVEGMPAHAEAVRR